MYVCTQIHTYVYGCVWTYWGQTPVYTVSVASGCDLATNPLTGEHMFFSVCDARLFPAHVLQGLRG